jgi:hypothetical protein
MPVVHFRRAYGTRIFLFIFPATEVAGYYQRSLRDLEIQKNRQPRRRLNL